MKADDVPEEWLDALISPLPAKAAALVEEIDFRAALAAVAPLIERAAFARAALAAKEYVGNWKPDAEGPTLAEAILAMGEGAKT